MINYCQSQAKDFKSAVFEAFLDINNVTFLFLKRSAGRRISLHWRVQTLSKQFAFRHAALRGCRCLHALTLLCGGEKRPPKKLAKLVLD